MVSFPHSGVGERSGNETEDDWTGNETEDDWTGNETKGDWTGKQEVSCVSFLTHF